MFQRRFCPCTERCQRLHQSTAVLLLSKFPIWSSFFISLGGVSRWNEVPGVESVDTLLEWWAWGFVQGTLPGNLGWGISSALCGASTELPAHRGAGEPRGAIAGSQGFSSPWLSGDRALCLGGSCPKDHNQKAFGSWFTKGRWVYDHPLVGVRKY